MAPKAAAAGASANAKAKAKGRAAPRMRVRRARVLRSNGNAYQFPFHKSAGEQGCYLDFLWKFGNPTNHGVAIREGHAAEQIAKFFILSTEEERGRQLARLLIHSTPGMMRKITGKYQRLQRQFATLMLQRPALAVTDAGVCVPVTKRAGRLID